VATTPGLLMPAISTHDTDMRLGVMPTRAAWRGFWPISGAVITSPAGTGCLRRHVFVPRGIAVPKRNGYAFEKRRSGYA